jgi:hypothetical protein
MQSHLTVAVILVLEERAQKGAHGRVRCLGVNKEVGTHDNAAQTTKATTNNTQQTTRTNTKQTNERAIKNT